jgi:hypothetical protein
MVIPRLLLLLKRQTSDASAQYKNDNNSGALLAIHGTFCGAAVLTVVLRLYVRIFMLKSLGVDDYIMLAAAVSSPTCAAGAMRTKD